MVRIQGNENFLRNFSEYLEKEQKKDPRLTAISTEMKSSQKAPGGLGLAVPPELLLSFGTAVATAIGTSAGKLIWEKLKAFISSTPNTSKETIVIQVEKQKVSINLNSLGEDAPEILVNLE